jgi:hypothetical protein
MGIDIIRILGLVLVALVLGRMMFFACIMIPLVFTKLPLEISGPFIRKAFPVYSLAMAILVFFSGGPFYGNANFTAFIFRLCHVHFRMESIDAGDQQIPGCPAGRGFIIHKTV